MVINFERQKRSVDAILKDKINGVPFEELIDAVIDHVADLDDDVDDRKGMVDLILLALMKARIEYKVDSRIELPPITTDDTWLLYNDVYNGLYNGQRFAMWYKDAEAVYNVASIPGNYLEIGTAYGGSAIMAYKAKKDGAIYCVDPLENSFGFVKKNFEKFGVKANVIRKMTPPIPEELDDVLFSAVLIDGDHTVPFPTNDWLGVKDKVVPGGYVMFHDIHRKACHMAYEEACKTPGWKSVALYCNIGHGFSTDKTMGTHGIVQKEQ